MIDDVRVFFFSIFVKPIGRKTHRTIKKQRTIFIPIDKIQGFVVFEIYIFRMITLSSNADWSID